MLGRRLLPWILSTAVHVVLALLLLSVGVIFARGWKDQANSALGDEALFTFEAAPIDAPVIAQSAPAFTAPPVRENAEVSAVAIERARTTSLAMLAMTQRDRDALTAEIRRPIKALETPRDIVSVAGLRRTSARRIVFLLDASGSMLGAYATAVQEVINSITRMSSEQQFAVVAFQGGEAFLAESAPLRRAGPTLGQRALDQLKAWLLDEIVPGRNSDARNALRTALAMRPDTIIIVSAGLLGVADRMSDRDMLLSDLDALNPRDARTGRRAAQIACIHLMEAEPLGALEAIAREHGGPAAYRFVRRMSDIALSDDVANAQPADETTERLDRAIALLNSGETARARIDFLRIGLAQPLHRASPVALVSAAEISLLNDRDLPAAGRLAHAALQGARAFGLESTGARAEAVLRAVINPSTSSLEKKP